ncbi:MAG: hypothetical protein IPG50_20385 [Myxococcales bacterium]|nr:hypothetical protein [Myxococcales bacterium]
MRPSILSLLLTCSLFACSAGPTPEAATDEGAVVGSEPNLAQLLSATRHVSSQRDGAYASVGLDRKVKAAIATLKPAGEVAGGVPCTQPATTLTFEEIELSPLATATIQCGRGSLAITNGATHAIVVDEAALGLVFAEEARLGDAMWEWHDVTVWGGEKESEAVPRERAGSADHGAATRAGAGIDDSVTDWREHVRHPPELRGGSPRPQPRPRVRQRGETQRVRWRPWRNRPRRRRSITRIGTIVVDATPFLRMVPALMRRAAARAGPVSVP